MASFAQHPCVLRTAALRRIHNETAALERHSGQCSGNDRRALAMQDKRTQIDMAGLHAPRDESRGGGGLGCRLGGVGVRARFFFFLPFLALTVSELVCVPPTLHPTPPRA